MARKTFIIFLSFFLGFLVCLEFVVRDPLRVTFSSQMTKHQLDSLHSSLEKQGIVLILEDTAYNRGRLSKIEGKLVFDGSGDVAGFSADNNFGEIIIERDLLQNGGVGSTYVYGKNRKNR
ncbi:MAG: hypothetical protein BRD50_02185 [Bacteroidetes bacterium SW_11_45_7]|nr:MAG: hypothetical protein BRD50_02185 [Bacteroidetes bacterium SW_11_45_7]